MHDTVSNAATPRRAGGVTGELIGPAILAAFRKLSPRQQFRNPVMFVVFVCSILTTGLWIQALGGHGEATAGFILWVGI